MLIYLIIMNKNIIHRNFIWTSDGYYFLNLETIVPIIYENKFLENNLYLS